MSVIDVTIQYQISKEFCSCCGHELEKSLSEVREFDIILNNIIQYANWQNIDAEDINMDEVSEMVGEYIYDTITFFAVSSNDRLHLGEGEEEKVSKMLYERLIGGIADEEKQDECS